MKDDTKKLIVVGGAVAIAGYFLLMPAGEEGGLGGGGGMPLLPAIPEAAPEAAPITGAGAPAVYNFPAMEAPVWGMEEQVDIIAKKVPTKPSYAPSLTPTYPLEYYASGGVSELSAAATPAQKLKSVMELQHFGDPFAYIFSGRTDRITSKKSKGIEPTMHKPLSLKGHQLASLKFTPSKKSGVSYGPKGESYNVPGVTYGSSGITYSRPAGPPRPKKYSAPGSPD